MIAAYFGLLGKNVDIVTSSKNLAIRDSQENEIFFQSLNLTVGHNIDFYLKYEKSQKNVYQECKILYGTVSEFTADYLRDFSNNEQISKREKNILIVDEVDNMLIDSSNFITKLSDSGKGLEQLQNVRKFIWTQLNVIIYSNGGKEIDNIDQIIEHMVLKEKDNKNFFTLNSTQEEIFNMLLQKWIKYAINSLLHYKEDQDYIIQDKKVIIVDKDNTGELQENCRWSHGLHNFLELKHNLPLGKDGFTSIYYSNHKFFNNYKQEIYGLTGTLGSQICRQFLSDQYLVDQIEIPTFNPKQFRELSGILCKQNWTQNIVENVKDTIQTQKRPVLIILQDIQQVKHISQKLKQQNIEVIDYYMSNEKELHNKINNIKNPIAIVATNLAGRGTDIKLNQNLEKNGGLRVIIGFIPNNLRTELQAFGRTSRKGNPGDGLIITRPEIGVHQLNYLDNIKQLKQVRDKQEIMFINEEAKQMIDMIKLKDEMFDGFCQFIKKNPSIQKNQNIFNGLSEQWGQFYVSLEIVHKKKSIQEQQKLFQKFMQQLEIKYQKNDFSNNSIHYLKEANKFINQNDEKKAKEMLKKSEKYCQNKSEILQRKAAIENNKGNFKKCIKLNQKSVEEYSKEITKQQFSQIMENNTGLVCTANRIFKKQQQKKIDLKSYINQQNVQNEINEIQDLNIEEYNKEKNEQMNQQINKFQKNAEMISNVAMQNQKNLEKQDNQQNDQIQHNFNIQNQQKQETQSYQQNEQYDEIEQIKQQNKDQQKIQPFQQINLVIKEDENDEVDIQPDQQTDEENKGYLGYILGGLSVAIGAACAYFSGGLLSNFGVGLVINGFKTMYDNYEMNDNNAYDSSKVYQQMILGSVFSLVTAFTSMNLATSQFVNQNFHHMINTLFNQELLKETIIQTVVQIGANYKFEDIKNVIYQTFAMKDQSQGILQLMQNSTEDEKQEIVNDQIKYWYDNQVKNPCKKYDPQQTKKFYDKLSPKVNLQCQKMIQDCQIKEKFSVYCFYIALDSNQQNRLVLFEYIKQEEKELQLKFLNSKTDVQLSQVINQQNFNCLNQYQPDKEIKKEFLRILKYIKEVYQTKNLLYKSFIEFINEIMKDINSKQDQLMKQLKNFKFQDQNQQLDNYQQINDRKVQLDNQIKNVKNQQQISMEYQSIMNDNNFEKSFQEYSEKYLYRIEQSKSFNKNKIQQYFSNHSQNVQDLIYKFQNNYRIKNLINECKQNKDSMNKKLKEIIYDIIEQQMINQLVKNQ